MPVPLAAPAAISVLENIPGMKRLFRVPSHKRAAALAPTLYALANKASGEGVIEARQELQRLTTEAATARSRAVYKTWWDRLPANRRRTTAGGTAKAKTPAEQFQETLGISPMQAAQLAAGPAPRQSTSRRVLQGYDELGRPVYKTVRTAAAGARRGAARAVTSRAGMAAARAITVAAFGVAAYLATRAVLRHFAGSAKRAQEAAVEGALALREARAEYTRQMGKAPSQPELRSMFDAYAVQLNKLGYITNAAGVPQYNRSKAQQFLTSYLSEEEQ